MGLKEFLIALINPIGKGDQKIYSYHGLAVQDDKILCRIAMNKGMIPLPVGKPNDPSEYWKIAREE